MKRLTILFLLCAVACGAQTLPPVRPVWVDETGAVVGLAASQPMPVDAVVTVGTLTINPNAPYDTIRFSDVSVTTGAAIVASMSNRRFIQIVNIGTETIWLGVNTVSATVSKGIPILTNQYYAENLDADVPIYHIASTPGSVTIIQGY